MEVVWVPLEVACGMEAGVMEGSFEAASVARFLGQRWTTGWRAVSSETLACDNALEVLLRTAFRRFLEPQSAG